jgi:hypothetical protein
MLHVVVLLLATHWPPNADGDSTDPIRAQSANKDKNLTDDFAAHGLTVAEQAPKARL